MISDEHFQAVEDFVEEAPTYEKDPINKEWLDVCKYAMPLHVICLLLIHARHVCMNTHSVENVFYDVMRSRHGVCMRACRVLADRALVYLNGTLGLAGQIIDLKTKASINVNAVLPLYVCA